MIDTFQAGGNHGRGITVDINNLDDALVAFRHAKESSKSGAIIVEKFITGDDYRLLVINNQLVASANMLSDFWYTAWVDAGQPDLSQLQNTPPSAELLEEMKSLDEHYLNDKHKGRICD